jgi:hypothetical protein
MSEQKQTEKKPTEAGDDVQRAILEEMRETNRLKKLELGRVADRSEEKLREADRATEEARQAMAESRGPEQRIRVRLQLTSSDAGLLPPVFATFECFKVLETDEKRRGEGPAAGKLRVRGVRDIDSRAATAALRAFHFESHSFARSDLARQGAKKELAEMDQMLENKWVRASVWRDCTLQTFRLVGRLLPELLASGAVTIVEPDAQ